jgi:hypothetical protein
MTAVIYNWRGGDNPPVPEAVRQVGPFPSASGVDKVHYTVEIDDLAAFIEKHGPMIVSPPGSHPYQQGWFIWFNGGSSRFSQA